MWRVIFSLVLLFGLFLTGGSPVNGAEAEERSRLRDIRRSSQEKVLRGVLTIYIWKMTDAVGLTDQQAAKIFPKIREAFQIRWESAAKRRHLLQRLQRAIDSVPQEEEGLKRLLAEWEKNEAKLHAAQEEMREALKRVLTPQQEAKSLLFEEQFEGDLIRVIAKIRKQSQRVNKQNRAKER